jgi:hypothetical protein
MRIKSFLKKVFPVSDIEKRLTTELDKAKHDRLDHQTAVEDIEATIHGSNAQLDGERGAIEICDRRIARLQEELSRIAKEAADANREGS